MTGGIEEYMQSKRGGRNRTVRINEEIRKELSQILQQDLKDPRIDLMTSVVRTETTRDLKYCKVYVSVLGSEDHKKEVKEALKSAAGFIRRELARRINLRVTPELTFVLDDSIEYSIYMSEMLKSVEIPQEEPEEDEVEEDEE